MIHSALVDHFTDEELRSVIGHECGHIHNTHVVYLTTLHYLTHIAARVPRRGSSCPAMLALIELVAPRRDHLRPRGHALLEGQRRRRRARSTKLALGSQKLYDEFNLDAFLEQYEEGKDGIGRYMRGARDAPVPAEARPRAARLRRERALPEARRPRRRRGLSMTEVDDKVHEHHQGRSAEAAHRSSKRGRDNARRIPRAEARRHRGAAASSATIAGGLGAKSARGRASTATSSRSSRRTASTSSSSASSTTARSTFVNALLGETVLPVGVTPTTAVDPPPRVRRRAERRRSCTRRASASRSPSSDVRKFAVGGERASAGRGRLPRGRLPGRRSSRSASSSSTRQA